MVHAHLPVPCRALPSDIPYSPSLLPRTPLHCSCSVNGRRIVQHIPGLQFHFALNPIIYYTTCRFEHPPLTHPTPTCYTAPPPHPPPPRPTATWRHCRATRTFALPPPHYPHITHLAARARAALHCSPRYLWLHAATHPFHPVGCFTFCSHSIHCVITALHTAGASLPAWTLFRITFAGPRTTHISLHFT